MWPPIWVKKGRELEKIMRRKYARMGQKKNARNNERISCTFWWVYVLIGWVLCQRIIHTNINTRHLEVCKICLFCPPERNSQFHYHSSKPESLKAALNERWHSTRTSCPAAASYRIIERNEWRHFIKTVRVPVPGGDCTATMYSIYYIHTIALQQQSITMTS